ncbi:MAG TPA: M13 family metallopeptidase, partial [Woeseiaceae bacterium]|nr:M13 family metallopeptidase [Woeseiaceae bacterium]
ATTEIPADQSGWGSFNILRDNGLAQLREIVQDVSSDANADDAAAKIGTFYNAWMDVERADSLGVEPLSHLFARIDAVEDFDDVVAFFGSTNELGLDAPFNLFINQDAKSPDRYVIITWQSGLGLPDRDYYFDESERGRKVREAYVHYVETVLRLSGLEDSEGAAKRIMALETSFAEHHWDKVENRDADKTYNKVTDAELGRMLSNFDLDAYFSGVGTGRQDYVIVSQPSYLQALNELAPKVDMGTWKEYLRLQVLTSYGNYLSKEFVDARFDFFGRMLQGREKQLPRWKRAIDSINDNLGELLGQLYVERHFPPQAKERMVHLVDNLILAYKESIRNLDWMSDETKARALEKLSRFTPKIGYPDKWKDYSGLEVSAGNLVGNIERARILNHYREVDKLGKPVDRSEWFMSPQTVNAYYNPSMNEIVFPAAILQPPFFVMDAEDARNYGAIGLVIGHEIGHGFDDQGSKYDGDGRLKNWWTDEDRARFEERTQALVEQYNGFEALPGLFINGELTLGENIGDLGGAAIALRAYELSLDGKESPVIDGLTGRERFFLGFAQVWRSKYRPETTELRVKSDPHSPPVFRVNGVVRNLDAFYETFNVNEGDGHYLAPEERVHIWR